MSELEEPTGTYTKPKDGWVCFHCGERFKNEGSAKLHFGTFPKAQRAGCLIKIQAGNEKGLLMELRKVEEEKRILLVKIQRLEFKLKKLI